MGIAELDQDLEEVVALYKSGVHSTDIAVQYGVTYDSVLKRLRAQGVAIRPRGGGKKCPPMLSLKEARRLVKHFKKNPRITLDELGAKFGVGRATARRTLIRQGMNHPRPRRRNPIPVRDRPPKQKARQVTSTGYIQIWLPQEHPYAAMCQARGWVLEHRVVMAGHLDRPLLPTETVHHRNGKRQDNRLSNLDLRQGNHGNGQSFLCADCGSRNLVAI